MQQTSNVYIYILGSAPVAIPFCRRLVWEGDYVLSYRQTWPFQVLLDRCGLGLNIGVFGVFQAAKNKQNLILEHQKGRGTSFVTMTVTRYVGINNFFWNI